MKMISQDEAKTLAVSYAGFWEAKDSKNENSAQVWAIILDDIQIKTGIVLISSLSSYRSVA